MRAGTRRGRRPLRRRRPLVRRNAGGPGRNGGPAARRVGGADATASVDVDGPDRGAARGVRRRLGNAVQRPVADVGPAPALADCRGAAAVWGEPAGGELIDPRRGPRTRTDRGPLVIHGHFKNPLRTATSALSSSLSGSSRASNRAARRATALLHRGPQQPLLVLLLRLVAAAVEGVHGGARRGRAVGRAAVPEVGVHHHDGAGPAGHQHLVGMRRRAVGQSRPAAACPSGASRARRAIAPLSAVKSSSIQTVLQTQ